jgi:hypothetical protein
MSPTPHSNGQGPPGMGPSYSAPAPPNSKQPTKPGKVTILHVFAFCLA